MQMPLMDIAVKIRAMNCIKMGFDVLKVFWFITLTAFLFVLSHWREYHPKYQMKCLLINY